MILGNIRNFEPGAGAAALRRRAGAEAAAKEQELLTRLRALPDGERKADEAKRMIDRVRTFAGYREYPKYGMVSRYFAYKQALLREAERLVQAGVLREREDIFYLTFEELQRRRRARTGWIEQLIRGAQGGVPVVPGAHAAARAHLGRRGRRRRVPPRRPAGRRAGRPGRLGRDRRGAGAGRSSTWRRPISSAGDILVTAYTDPSWTPLFVAITGLVTEVGGLMTHGAVIAREYGLPAVVGVEHATRLIRDGQRIRVHGTDGYVEILP